ncbi:RCC1 domain-containing protein [Legionella fallonii]|uniref:Regulator of chromosome condensation, RCC1 n=1 Tax=Legionella fallonii LLAP-10 TaxID=1212491 RepID=A0A098FZD7_9GAMM|nr:hypothetical protein [Legionella fallonii]CEG55593.1 protein of unknown function [Legionella fallonii LLAP-10]
MTEIYSNHNLNPSFFLLTESGKLYAFGTNNEGQLGIGKKTWSEGKLQLVHGESIGKIIQVKSGRLHSVLLNEDGEVYVTGSNKISQLGREGDGTSTFEKVNLEPFGRVISLECGPFFTVAMTAKGQLIAWGYNIYGALGLDSGYYRSTPSPIDLPQVSGSILDVVASDHATYVITPTQVYGTCFHKLGSSSPNSETAGLHPIPQLMSQKIIKLISGENFCIVQNKQGQLFGWDKPTVEEVEDIKRIDEPTQLPMQARIIKCARNEILVLTPDYQLKLYEVDRIGTMKERSLSNRQVKLLLEQTVIEDYMSREPLLGPCLYSSRNNKQLIDLFFTPSAEQYLPTSKNASDLMPGYDA